jgi:uracil-DNA glycosylase
VKIKTDWDDALKKEFKKEYFINLKQTLKDKKSSGEIIYPPQSEIFNAFNLCPLSDAKVIIIGQDPYHGEKQAHGLSFSVKNTTKLPPSLKNIFKELHRDLGVSIPETGNLESWAKQGVLLLNSVLTVTKQSPGSHRKIGWEIFTDKVIDILNDKENLIFILWGNDAKKKAQRIDKSKHYILESSHPSPFSVKNFSGNSHFSKTNKLLKKLKRPMIKWDLE